MNFEKVGEADKGGSGFDGTLLAKSDALRLDFEVLLLVQRNHDPNGDIAKGFAEVDAELGIEHDVLKVVGKPVCPERQLGGKVGVPIQKAKPNG